MNHLTQVKQATASLTPSELRDLSAHVAALLAAKVATSTNAPTCASPTPGLNGRSNNHQTNDALNWWEKEQDDAWWQSEEWQALRQQVLGVARNLYLRWRVGSRQRSKYLGKAPVQRGKAPALVAAQRSVI